MRPAQPRRSGVSGALSHEMKLPLTAEDQRSGTAKSQSGWLVAVIGGLAR